MAKFVASFKKRGELLQNKPPHLPQIENENIAKGTTDQSLTNSCDKLKKPMYQFWQIYVTTKRNPFTNFDKSMYQLR